MRLLALVFLISLLIFCVQKEGTKVEVVSSSFSANCGSGENFYRISKNEDLTEVEFGVNLPNPCFEVKADVDNGVLTIHVERREGACIQCLAYGSGVIKVEGEVSKVEIYVDGTKVEIKGK